MLISTLVRIKYQKGALKRVESDCFQACEWGGEGCGGEQLFYIISFVVKFYFLPFSSVTLT